MTAEGKPNLRLRTEGRRLSSKFKFQTSAYSLFLPSFFRFIFLDWYLLEHRHLSIPASSTYIMGLFKHLVKELSHKSHKENDGNTAQAETPTSSIAPPIPPRDYATGAYQSAPSETPKSAPQIPLKPQHLRKSISSSSNFFENPISTDPPVNSIKSSEIHPVNLPKLYNASTQGPIETNNFYGNMLVEDQNLPVWTHPYSLWKCTDPEFHGLGISHTANSQKVYGDDPNANPVKYFFNPVGICSVMLSSEEFQQSGYDFQVGDLTRFSAGIKFINGSGEMKVNLVQGMGFITAIYSGGLTPSIASKVGIQNLTDLGVLEHNGMIKYKLTLFDNTNWIVYSTVRLSCISPNRYISSGNANSAIIQIGKISSDADIDQYNQAAGAYVTGCTLSGSLDSDTATYSFEYTIGGKSNSGNILQWFLPHHVESMHSTMQKQLAGNTALDSTCKGIMRGFLTTKFVMEENLPPKELLFDPWSDKYGCKGYSEDSIQFIERVAREELERFNVAAESATDSMYTAGKILDKGAFMLYVSAFVIRNKELTVNFLDKMKQAFDLFLDNRMQNPLVYNNTWKGIVSTAGLADGNFYCDFGNCFYNDHHFHYGYHVHAAAIVALVDKQFGDGSWVNKAKSWVETLIRDYCNPSSSDPYFPVFRSFDFFNGHSFANGLFAHGDGKDEESSSEDYHAHYGVKLWATVTGNTNLETVSSLILSVEKRAMNMYMLYKRENKIVPPNFISNKVSGILFENKIDHATYFGMNKEYIHGIHMIPLSPMSNFIRDSVFVSEEWQDMQLGNLAMSIDSGWKGLLILNQAIIDPKAAWNFFSDPNFNYAHLDNGMSRTWSLAYCAGMGASV